MNRAIKNGREHLRRLVRSYDFEDRWKEGGSLRNCVDYRKAVECFEELVSEIEQLESDNARLNLVSLDGTRQQG